MLEQSSVLPALARQAVSALAKTLVGRFALVLTLLALFGVPSARLLAQAPTAVAVPTWRYDLTHAGQNTQETELTPANVNVNSFGKLFTHTTDGVTYAQPLYVPGLKMSDGLVHNVIFVATEHDSVFAFDADSNGGANANPIWQVSLISTAHGAAAGATTVPWVPALLNDIEPEIGITGTPAINQATNTMYVVAASEEGGQYVMRLHALNILTGAEQPNSPVLIQATVAGTGNGSSGGQLAFSPYWDNQRAALDYYNGYVYIAFASHGDEGDYHGWLFAYNATTMAQTSVFCLTPNGAGAGIWGAGAGLPIDNGGTAGRLFLVSGNGTYGANEWGESIMNFSLAGGKLTPTDSFTSFNQAKLTQSDLDQGSGGVLMVPNQDGANANLLVNVGKEGRILVLNRNDLGGYAAGASSNTNIPQDILGETGGLWSTPAYWNGNVYMWGSGDVPKMFTMNSGVLDGTPSSKASVTSAFPGANFTISSNGTQDGIAWAVRTDMYTTHGAGILYAWNANSLADELYESDTNNARDTAGGAMKFEIPVVTNGKVYLAGSHLLDVYGLLNGEPTAAKPVITPDGGTFSAAQPVSMTSTTASAGIYYTLDGSTPTTQSTPYLEPFSVSADTVVNAIASAPNYLQSAVSTATFTFATQTPTPSFTPAGGTYTGAQSVTIADADTNAKIYYTTNGAPPTASSTLYTVPIAVTASETINAIAIDPALTNSSVATAVYVISATGPTINFSNGFSEVTGLKLNGSTVNTDDSRLQLTNGGLNEAGSVFWSQPVGISSFTTQFIFQLSNAVADGFTFTIQNVGPTALGSSGAALGYAPIKKSVAIKFDLYSNSGEGTDSTGVYINGAVPTVPAVDMTSSGILLRSGDGMLATMTYNGTTLTMVLTDVVTNKTFTLTKAINIPATVGANTAYVGFTGGTGGLSSSQKILSWTYTAVSGQPIAPTPTPTFTPAAGTYTGAQSVTIADTDTNAKIYYTTNGVTPTASSTLYTVPIAVSASETIKAIAIDPALTNSTAATAAYVISATGATPTINFSNGFSSVAGLKLNGSTANTNSQLLLTNGGLDQAGSVFWSQPVNVQSFTTQFKFQLSNAVADGFTFTIQNVGPTALGSEGEALGYYPIKKSVAIKFGLYSNITGEGTDSTGVFIDGAMPSVPSVDMTSSGVILRSGDAMLANVTYNGTTLTMVLTDTVTSKTFTLSKAINIPTTVGANTAYVGFTGGTGGLSSSQKILDWTYTVQ